MNSKCTTNFHLDQFYSFLNLDAWHCQHHLRMLEAWELDPLTAYHSFLDADAVSILRRSKWQTRNCKEILCQIKIIWLQKFSCTYIMHWSSGQLLHFVELMTNITSKGWLKTCFFVIESLSLQIRYFMASSKHTQVLVLYDKMYLP